MGRKLSDWIASYREYTAESESPEAFHVWTGLSVLSAVTKRNIWLDWGYYFIYPNLYVVLVSPPGKCRKGVAMGIGHKLLAKVPGVNIEANKMTTSALINSMSGGGVIAVAPTKSKTAKQVLPTVQVQSQCTCLLYSTEFSVMLGADANQTGMLSLLTDLYDCPNYWDYKTIGRGKEILNNVFLGILGATTPDWLTTSIPADAIGGGFTSRILFIAQHRRRHDNPRPRITPAMLRLRSDLQDDLIHISKLQGEMKLDDDAGDFYDFWYKSQDTAPQVLDERFWGYLERKPVHLLKVATLLAIAKSDSNEIGRIELIEALALLEQVETHLPSAFRGIGSPKEKDISRVIDQLTARNGFAPFSEIMKENIRYLNEVELNGIVRTMVSAGILKEAFSGIGLNSRVLLLTTSLAQGNGVDDGNTGGGPESPAVEASGEQDK